MVARSPGGEQEWDQTLSGVAAHLEYAAAIILWLAEGRTTGFKEFAKPWTLGRAAKELKRRELLTCHNRNCGGRRDSSE